MVKETMLDIYLFETFNQLESLEEIIVSNETSHLMTQVDEIFRIMHTIKGSSAMMSFNHISTLAHAIEDAFFIIREDKERKVNYEKLSDLMLESIDCMKTDVEALKTNPTTQVINETLIERIEAFIEELSKEELDQHYKVTVFFEEGCLMEDVRACSIISQLNEITESFTYSPAEVLEDSSCADTIQKNGFEIQLATTKSYETVKAFFENTMFVKTVSLELVEKVYQQREIPKEEKIEQKIPTELNPKGVKTEGALGNNQNIMSVSVNKLDRIMDLLGEIVVAQSMVVENPDLHGLKLENFQKAARGLIKITNELQNEIMSIRMVPMSMAFSKMKRVVRDMGKSLGKVVELEFVGEETEVDKKVIEYITDPLMHMVRNAMDHGMETVEERIQKNKSTSGKITLEARHEGREVIILVKDDGKGIDKKQVLLKAQENGLLTKPIEEMQEDEIYQLILRPGFSTKQDISEYSGRGVGMDVVVSNIEKIGGTVSLESVYGKGSTFIIRIPLTMAIIEGMNIKVGEAYYTVPITVVEESFRPKENEMITTPEGAEMIVLRNECYPLVKLFKLYQVPNAVQKVTEGIVIKVGQGNDKICLLADELVGQQQVVIKELPNYILSKGKIPGVSGCALLGDGNISLILELESLLSRGVKND